MTSIALIVLGTGVIIFFSFKSYSAYREIRFVRLHHFNSKNPDTSVVRPWMSIQYVSSAFRIPEEYLFQKIGIPMTQKNSLSSFRMLNSSFHIGPEDDVSILLRKVQAAIDAFDAQAPVIGPLQRSGALLRPPQGSVGDTHSSYE